MTNKLKYILFFTIPFVLLFITCTKYPEDAKNLWTSPDERIKGHQWTVVEFTVDGVDSLNNLFSSQRITTFNNVTTVDTVYWSFLGAKLSFLRDYGKNILRTYLKVFYTSTYHPNERFIGGSWDFEKNNANIRLWIYEYWEWDNFKGDFYYLGATNNNIWTIKKLTDKEFIIENRNNNNKLYRLKMN